MRIAILSDIHGNLTAFEAVLGDLRQTSPDLILHGGDLADAGSSPTEVIERIRDLGWRGVLGNTDEMLWRPEALQQFATQSPHLESLFTVIEEMAAFTREMLGSDRLAWLGDLPVTLTHNSVALVHASPGDPWRAPGPEATDAEMESVYRPLGQPVAVYAHIHRPCIRYLAGLTVINTGSVSLSYDGDPRASYLLLDHCRPSIRRVEYDLDKEAKALHHSGLPYANWIVKTLQTACAQMP